MSAVLPMNATRKTTKLFQCVWTCIIICVANVLSCGYQVSGRRGELTSPNYPNNYMHNLYCKWQISVEKTETITIQILDLDIVYVYYRCSDQLLIYDGPEIKHNRLLLKRCGLGLPKPLVSSGDVVTMIFHTNNWWSGKGFRLIWKVSDNFTVMLSPMSWYEAKKNCTQEGGHLADVNDITLPSFMKIMYNYKEGLWVGQYYKNTLHHCRTIRRIKSQFNIKTDGNCNRATGFICQKEAVVCGEDVTTANGTISSPDYPNGYSNYIFCEWKLSVFEGYSIKLLLHDVDLEISRNCSNDYVEILTVSGNISTRLKKLCAKTSNLTVASSSSTIIIKFRSDINTSGSGFLMTWHSEIKTTTSSHSIATKKMTVVLPNQTDTSTFIDVTVDDIPAKLEVGTIVGTVICGVFVIAASALTIFLCQKRYKRGRNPQKETATDINMASFEEASKAEREEELKANDMYSKPLPKGWRPGNHSSAEITNSSETYSDSTVIYNHLNKTELNKDVPEKSSSSCRKLAKEVNLSSVAAFDSTYDHLNEEKNSNDHLSVRLKGVQHDAIDDPYYDYSQSVYQSNVNPQNTYDHLDLKPTLADGEISRYSVSQVGTTSTSSIYNHLSVRSDKQNNDDDLNDETYYNCT